MLTGLLIAAAVRTSLPLEDDATAWTRPGLVVEAGVGAGRTGALKPAAAYGHVDVSLRVLLRLERFWSIAGTVRYASGVGTSGFAAHRSAFTLETVLHPAQQWGVSLGLGYAREITVDLGGARFPTNDTAVSHTLPRSAHLELCDGDRVTALARVDRLWITGETFATGPYVLVDALALRCTGLQFPDPDTGRYVELAQWWRQGGVSLGWWLAWR